MVVLDSFGSVRGYPIEPYV